MMNQHSQYALNNQDFRLAIHKANTPRVYLIQSLVLFGGCELDVNGFAVGLQPVLPEGHEMHTLLMVAGETANSTILRALTEVTCPRVQKEIL